MPLQEEPTHSLHVTSPSLSSLVEFPEKYALRLQRAGLTTVSEVILTSPESLKSQTGLSSEEVEEVYQSLSELCSPKVSTISERIKASEGIKRSFISLGTASLDRLFGKNDSSTSNPLDDEFSTNGVPTGLITEIAGESACGKTCLCLQLSLNVQVAYPLGGLQGGCIYLCTESAFPSSRLYEMAVGLCERWKQNSSSFDISTREAIDRLDPDELMEDVHLLRAHDPQTLIHTIHYSLPAFLDKHIGVNHSNRSDRHATKSQDERKANPRQKPIRLIVLDSIGAIFRADVEQKVESSRGTKFRMTERASEMNQVADGLKYLADRYQLAVVVVNQVSDVIDMASRSMVDFSRASDGGNVDAITVAHHSNNQQRQEATQNDRLDTPNHHQQPPPSSSNNSSSAANSCGTLTPSTPSNNEYYDKSFIPLDYYQQARHFTGQKVTNNRKEAALGLAWTNAINIRIMLNKLDISYDLHNQLASSPILSDSRNPGIKKSSLKVREAVIVFSPFGKTASDSGLDQPVQFVITSHGIVSLRDLSNQISST